MQGSGALRDGFHGAFRLLENGVVIALGDSPERIACREGDAGGKAENVDDFHNFLV